MLKVFGTRRSPPVNAVCFTANYLELDHEFVLVNMLEGEHRSEWYMKLHPAGKVPSIDDDGFAVFESVAMSLRRTTSFWDSPRFSVTLVAVSAAIIPVMVCPSRVTSR